MTKNWLGPVRLSSGAVAGMQLLAKVAAVRAKVAGRTPTAVLAGVLGEVPARMLGEVAALVRAARMLLVAVPARHGALVDGATLPPEILSPSLPGSMPMTTAC